MLQLFGVVLGLYGAPARIAPMLTFGTIFPTGYSMVYLFSYSTAHFSIASITGIIFISAFGLSFTVPALKSRRVKASPFQGDLEVSRARLDPGDAEIGSFGDQREVSIDAVGHRMPAAVALADEPRAAKFIHRAHADLAGDHGQ
jgi:hypothetical protein